MLLNFFLQKKGYLIYWYFFPVAVQESLKSELEREATVRANFEAKCKETEESMKSIQAKSKQLISALQQQVEEQSNARVGTGWYLGSMIVYSIRYRF